MKIEYLGHSSFKITSNGGVTVVTDPYAPEIGFKMPSVSANAVTVSHHHFDHDNIKAVGGNPKVIDGTGVFEVDGVKIEGISSYHDEACGKKRGNNTVYKISMDGVTVCHLGDLGEKYSEELCAKIGPVDVLLIPVGGNYTIDAVCAKQFVEGIGPGAVIPMHYRTPDLKVDIEKLDKFTKLYDCCEDGGNSEIELTLQSFGDKMRIIVLRRA